MTHDLIVAMNVTDEATYALYREEMADVLARHGGRFAHDFRVAQTLTSDAPHPVTRIFALRFPDRAASDALFADPDYGAVRGRRFEASVDGFTVLAAHDHREGR